MGSSKIAMWKYGRLPWLQGLFRLFKPCISQCEARLQPHLKKDSLRERQFENILKSIVSMVKDSTIYEPRSVTNAQWIDRPSKHTSNTRIIFYLPNSSQKVHLSTSHVKVHPFIPLHQLNPICITHPILLRRPKGRTMLCQSPHPPITSCSTWARRRPREPPSRYPGQAP